MWSLGLVMEHDASATLARDGEIIAAISEERLSRKKGDWGYPWRAIDECLRIGGVSKEEIAFFSVVLNKFPGHFLKRETWWKEIEESVYRLKRKIRGENQNEKTVNLVEVIGRLKASGKELSKHFKENAFKKEGFIKARVIIVDHHFAHALTALLYSGFSEAIALTIDCEGPVFASGYTHYHSLASLFNRHLVKVSHTTNLFKNGQFVREHMSDSSTSPGSFYAHVTEGLGFKPNRHEGKITGLAALGDSHILYEQFKMFLDINVEKNAFFAPFSLKSAPNIGDAQKAAIKSLMNGHNRKDVAAAAQKVLEDSVTEHVRWYADKTGVRNLAIAGGVFGNVKLNQRLMELPEIDKIFVFPAMSDTGLSIGAALMPFLNSGTDFSRHIRKLNDVYLGPSYTNKEIESLLKNSGFKYESIDDVTRSKRIAELIVDGNVVGIFQGRMEFGPRALGNRSILASPTDPTINDWLNERLERSEFMPFAPSVLDFAAADIFENYSKGDYSAKFMTVTFTVKNKWRKKIPAVVHVDGTARPNVVSREDNPRYYDIIDEYYKLTNLPVLLNTSFNTHEEPIICKPEVALKAFKEKRIDVLILENFLLHRD